MGVSGCWMGWVGGGKGGDVLFRGLLEGEAVVVLGDGVSRGGEMLLA